MTRLSGLYVLVDPSACRGRDPIEVSRAALAGGASMLQWRDKARDKGEQLPELSAIWQLCNESDAVLVVNDHADLALVVGGTAGQAGGAIGVHVGQKDLPLVDVRRIVPAHYVVGISTNNADEARAGATN